MSTDLDTLFDRTGTSSTKWSRYPEDVLPMWVADMDFAAPPAVIERLQARLSHPVLGYSMPSEALRQVLVDYLRDHYDWQVQTQDIVVLPGVVPGVNMALHGLVAEGAGVVVHTPNYPPLREAAGHWKMRSIEVPLTADAQGEWSCDPHRLQQSLGDSAAFILSNPHNPLGKTYSRDELQAIADTCVAQNVLIISDEIHADLQFDGRRHVPIASLSPEVAERTITLMSASKTYNVAGLKTAFAVIQNAELRARFDAARVGMVDSVNPLGMEATHAAYAQPGEWLQQLKIYLQGNRDYLLETIRARLPGIVVHAPQSTYLAWLDCSALGLENPQRFFLQQARVGLSAGTDFGAGLEQFVRLNFGCPRSLLTEGLARIERSLQNRPL
ncbi:MalY/PatB family protein [Pseudomonas sp. CFBP 13602]|uniref:MalY/PatB family protein n=1 Tax=Pseudomonas sp. CFBP 13602 TaxID=2774039 RepID=UPI00178226F3|nr:PatB family C-S lyase [Pseudomonas sp. CFBP 13602]MBD8827642.1 putative C-S lyase [Pseudomonas sp. CFBP 13602]